MESTVESFNRCGRMRSRKCVLAAFVFIYGLANPSLHAQDSSAQDSVPGILYGIRIGLLAHDVGGLWSHSRAEAGVDVNAEIVFSQPRLRLWQGLILPNMGVSINSRHDTSKAYAGLLWEWVFGNGFFVNSGGGLAVHNGQLESDDSNKKQLGSRVLFRVPIEFGFTIRERHRISILFDHVSNAYLATPNEGMDTIGVRYGFQF